MAVRVGVSDAPHLRKRQEFDVAGRLRQLRSRRRITQEDLAAQSGVSAKYISEIENGHSSPTVAVLSRIVERGMDIPLSAFFAEHPREPDDVGQIDELLSTQPANIRRKAVLIIRALCE